MPQDLGQQSLSADEAGRLVEDDVAVVECFEELGVWDGMKVRLVGVHDGLDQPRTQHITRFFHVASIQRETKHFRLGSVAQPRLMAARYVM